MAQTVQRHDGPSGRHVLLLLGSASCHHPERALFNVVIFMLTPNTAAHLQPQDSGVIRALKARISAIKNKYFVERIDSLTERAESIDSDTAARLGKDLYDVYLLTAIRRARDV